MLGTLTRMQALQRQAKTWRQARTLSPTENPPPPDLTTYWQARYPRYQLAPHIRLMLDALNDLGDGEALIITMPPRHSKCQPAGSPVLMADGTTKTIETVKAGDMVVSVTERYTLDVARVSDAFENGTQEVIRLHLQSGRFIDCTLNHPLLTVNGYVEAGTLAQGDYMGVVRQSPEGTGPRLPEGYPAILGYLIGDGSTGQGDAIVTNDDPETIADFYRLAEMHGWQISRDGKFGYQFRRLNGRGPMASAPGPMLRPYGEGIFGCNAPKKRVPPSIFAAPNDQVAEFIAAYFACDGHIAHCRGGYAEMCSASEGLLRDMQQLITRFGIFTDLRSFDLMYNGELRTYWKLLARGSELGKFEAAFPLKSKKRAKLRQIIEANAHKRRFPVQESIPTGWAKFIKAQKHWFRKVHGIRFDKQYKEGTARHIVQQVAELDDNDHLRRLCSPDLLWEQITRIESLGAVQTHGLSVERDHVYVSGGVISHNSESVKAWLEWSLGQHPEDEAILASYAVDLARRHSRSIRNEIAGLGSGAFNRYFPAVTLAADSAAATDWALTAGGRFKAAGVGVGITGMGARFAAIDDPFKDRKQAESEITREGVWDWFTSAFLTRLTPDARIVLTHTRWHENDLVGKIQQRLEDGDTEELGGLRWRILNLPALAEEDDLLGREEGEALWPERYDLTRLEGIRDANPFEFAALYQQRPSTRGGTVFMDGVGTYAEPHAGQTYITVDTASSKRETADYSVLTAWRVAGHGAEARVDVLECRRARMDLLEFGAVAAEMQARYGVPLHIEDAGLAKPIIQYLQAQGLAVRPVRVSGDKFTRAQPYAAAWNGGRVRLPARPAWVSAFKSEHLAFTGTKTDAHDDQVDSGSLLFGLLALPAAPQLRSHIFQT